MVNSFGAMLKIKCDENLLKIVQEKVVNIRIYFLNEKRISPDIEKLEK